jgi:hypothetical protein
MSTILEAIGDYLQAQGQGTLGTNLFLGMMPETPDACVCVYESSGLAPMETMGTAAFAVEQPGLQVIARGARGDYPGARDKAVAVRALLAAVIETTISGIHVMRISADGSLLPMGEDQNGRPMVSTNFSCAVRP